VTKVIYDGKGNKLTCDLCGYGNRDVEVKKLVPPNPPPMVICTTCYQRDKAALEQWVSQGGTVSGLSKQGKYNKGVA
jgi:hypothetical protein